MSETQDGYRDGNAVFAAIKQVARQQARGASSSVDSLIRQATYDRFLCRIFSVGNPTFVLKGGTGMLARIPQTRATRDIDLAAGSKELGHAYADLIELAGVDLHDHFRFVPETRTDQMAGENQPYTNGCRVVFNVYIGVAQKGTLPIDLAVGYSPTAPPETRAPANRLPLPRLTSFDYILYAIPDQIADKLCAIVALYGVSRMHSSREKDLVDLVAIALHERIDASQLRIAIATEMGRRKLHPIVKFATPETWGAVYSKLARGIPFLVDYGTIDKARNLVAAMLDPILTGAFTEGYWDPASRNWVHEPRARSGVARR